MWVTGQQDIVIPPVRVLDELKALTGELDNETARITLAKFLQNNIRLATELLMGITLERFQELTIKGLFDRNYSMLVWGRGSGKSALYDKNDPVYLLEKEKGMIPLTSLLPDVEFKEDEYWMDFSPMDLWNGHGYQRVTRALVQKGKKCMSITTRNGYRMSGSTNHLIKCLDTTNGACKIIWKRYHELNKGDLICIDRKPTPDKYIHAVEELDEAYLVGLIIGDGCYSKSINNILFSSGDQALIDFISKYSDLKVQKDKRGKTLSIGLSVSDSRQLLDKYQMRRDLSYDKEIPSKILGSKGLLRKTLQGLFDTDGTVSKNGSCVSFCSTSKKLAFQVFTSLLQFGIVSSIKEKNTNSKFGKAWNVSIYGENVSIFSSQIGFSLARKRDIVDNALSRGRVFNTNNDTIPNVINVARRIKESLTIKRGESKWYDIKKLKGYRKNGISYRNLGIVIDRLAQMGASGEYMENLAEIQREHFYFDPVENIEEFEGNCIDFNVPTGEMYWSNGFISHNTFVAAIFCILQCIFEPGSKIIIASANFRTARRLFMEVDKILNSKSAFLAKQCFKDPVKRNDEYIYPVVNGGSIIAVPLSGENLRGYRASVLLIDEFLMVPKDIVERVLMPFLNSPLDIAERIRVREMEDELIKKGALKESDRIHFKNINKMVTLSSASYTFEYLYETYSLWSDIIENPSLLANADALGEDRAAVMKDSTYFVSQISYEYLPEHIMDAGAIQLAKSGGMSQSAFDREYRAKFVDGGDGYFSPKKMMACTITNGEYPTTRVIGDKSKKYILGIDPSLSQSKSSDYFAMSIMELDEERKECTLVHGYQKAGTSIQHHIKYLYYILTHFNIVLIVLDHAGGDQFIEAANGSMIFKQNGMKLEFLEFDCEKEGEDYITELQNTKNQYNLEAKKICINQYFTSNFVRRANEYLQSCIDHKRVWFASQACAHPDIFQQIVSLKLPLDLVFPKGIDDAPEDSIEREKVGVRDFLEQQDFIVRDTKEQCALIQVSSTTRGTQTFDMPSHLRRLTSVNKPRKDNYSSLMLGNWGAKCYFDLHSDAANKPDYSSFTPFFL